MAVARTVTYPSGVTTPRHQVHPVTIAYTGLSANTNYAVLINRPGSAITERLVRTDANGAVTVIDNPQVAGSHTIQLSTVGLDTFIPSGPTMSTVELKPTAVGSSTATYTVG